MQDRPEKINTGIKGVTGMRGGRTEKEESLEKGQDTKSGLTSTRNCQQS